MATKTKKSSTKSTDSSTNVTRFTAVDSAKVAKKSADKKVATATKYDSMTESRRKNPIMALLGYFKGAWYELRQVRWPNRKATWSLTAAVIVFTAFFALVILLLDALFKYLFELILG